MNRKYKKVKTPKQALAEIDRMNRIGANNEANMLAFLLDNSDLVSRAMNKAGTKTRRKSK